LRLIIPITFYDLHITIPKILSKSYIS